MTQGAATCRPSCSSFVAEFAFVRRRMGDWKRSSVDLSHYRFDKPGVLLVVDQHPAVVRAFEETSVREIARPNVVPAKPVQLV